jgi:putative DNA-invertase from lambdoid prophage Rac
MKIQVHMRNSSALVQRSATGHHLVFDGPLIWSMLRTFAYARVSTTGQATESQIQEIHAAGFHVEPRRIVTETISGSTAIAQRRGFTKLMDRLEYGDVLILTELDRLGHDVIDVSSTVKALAEIGVRLHCLAIGGVDLASSAGTMTMNFSTPSPSSNAIC